MGRGRCTSKPQFLVRRCADLGRDCPGFFFAVGNHIPFTVPIPNVECYLEAIREYGRR